MRSRRAGAAARNRKRGLTRYATKLQQQGVIAGAYDETVTGPVEFAASTQSQTRPENLKETNAHQLVLSHADRAFGWLQRLHDRRLVLAPALQGGAAV